jgi:orotidine-5'-phosphate decarboxylase
VSGRVFVALDLPAADAAVALARALAPLGVRFKVGLELFARGGPEVVRAVQAVAGPVFLDLKLHDIPNTVAGAARAAAALGVGWLTVHAAAGSAALRAAAEAAPDTVVLGVTVLTSLTAADLAAQGIARPPAEQAAALAELAVDAGCRGVVCSPQEVAVLRRRLPPASQLVVPGVRPTGAAAGDQARVATPAAAFAAGADFIVVGRPVTASPDPVAACRALLAACGAPR